MIADYFTKALQGALFWKLRDVIMGDTNIPLPLEMNMNTPDPSTGIPDGTTLKESRSVLKDKIAVSGSPRSLTVLPAFGIKTRQSVPTGPGSKKYMASKKTLTWAKIASENTSTLVFP
jgi:hypothetical protein